MPKGIPKSGTNKGWIKKGQRLSPDTQFKQGQEPFNKGKEHMPNELHPMWKGEKVKYAGLHMWIARHKDKPNNCQECGSDRFIQWANISGEYKRDLDDWIALCNSCHQKWDKGGKVPNVLCQTA